MTTSQVKVNENEFTEFHESLKERGAKIIRCIEISGAYGSAGLKQYQVTFLV